MEKLDNSEESGNYFDCHTHVQDYEPDILKLIMDNAIKSGVKHMMCNSTSDKDFEKVRNLCEKYSSVLLPSFGIHPWFLDDLSEDWEEKLAKILKEVKNSMVGEIGIDYYKQIPKEKQIEVFEKQFKLAIDLKKPVSIHCVRAHEDMLKIFQKYIEKRDLNKQQSEDWKMNILMHSYAGNSDITKKFLKLNANFYFSFSTLSIKRKCPFQVIPMENIVIETDSPYQVNEELLKEKGINPIIGRILPKEELVPLNEPGFLAIFNEKLAEVLNVEKTKLSKILFQNSKKVFNLI